MFCFTYKRASTLVSLQIVLIFCLLLIRGLIGHYRHMGSNFSMYLMKPTFWKAMRRKFIDLSNTWGRVHVELGLLKVEF